MKRIGRVRWVLIWIAYAMFWYGILMPSPHYPVVVSPQETRLSSYFPFEHQSRQEGLALAYVMRVRHIDSRGVCTHEESWLIDDAWASRPESALY